MAELNNNFRIDRLNEKFGAISIGSNDKNDLDDGREISTIRGSCRTMCPEEEMEKRQKQFLIHPLEATSSSAGLGQRMRISDRSKMVKCYSRPAAGKEISRPQILRPFVVLERTVSYLLSVTSTSNQFSWDLIYDFVGDRLRSVRQDLIIQELGARETMRLLGPMLQFYFYSKYRCELQKCSTYDAHLHSSQTDECVDRFLVAYLSIDDGRSSDEIETAFLRTVLLHRFKSKSTWTRLISSPHFRSLRNENFVGKILRLARAYRQVDFYNFFRVFVRLPIADRLAVAAGMDVADFRRRSLLVLKKAYARSKLPVNKISSWLAFRSEQDTRQCLDECGFQTSDTGLVDFSASAEQNGEFRPTTGAWRAWSATELGEYKLTS